MTLSGTTVLQVIPQLAAGGAERTVIEVVAALKEAGATALVASEGGRLQFDLEAAGGEHITLDKLSSKNPFDLATNARLLGTLIRERNVDIVHARSRAPAWSALWAARAQKVPFVTTYHGIYKATNSLKRAYNSVMARGDIVIANSGYTADHVRKQHPNRRDRIVVIPRGVDIEAFTLDAVSPERCLRLSRNWTLPEDDDRILIVLPARLTSWKGHREAVAAASLLRDRESLPPWLMVFAGDAQGRERYLMTLNEQIARLGLDEHVSIVGHCDDMPAAFALADIVIAPSIQPEAFGRVAAEAGAMGKPVVGSDLGGQKEVIASQETGLLTPPGHIKSLADAIEDLIRRGPEGRAAMGQAANARVLERYTSKVLQRSTLAQYEKLLGSKHG